MTDPPERACSAAARMPTIAASVSLAGGEPNSRPDSRVNFGTLS